MSKFTENMSTFIFGGFIGVIVGLLFAPGKGSHLRDKLSYRADKLLQTLEASLVRICEGRPLIDSQAKQQGENIIKNAKQQAERLLGDVNSLIRKINKK